MVNNNKTNKRISKTSKLLLLLASTATISTFAYSNVSLAEVNPTNLIDSGYLYADEDIRAVLKNRLDENNVYVAPALPFESQDLVTDIIRDSVNEARVKGTSLVPINFGNVHWTALAIKRTNTGTIKVIYNDSVGSPISGRANSALLANILQHIDPTIQIVDLQVHQQTDGTSCGAYTAENLIKIAELDVSNLTDDQLRSVLASINDAGALRNSHFYLLYEGEGVFDVNELKPRAQGAVAEFKNQNRQLIRNIINVASLTNDRLNSLNRSNNTNSFLRGIAAGDGELNYGAWIKGFIGRETDKANIGSGANSNTSKSNSNIYGFVIGADTKIDEDLTIGLAYSNIASNTKQKISGISTNKDKISSHVFSIYGSCNFDEDISLDSSIAYGKALIKTSHAGVRRSSKQKGDLFGSGLAANYKLYQIESIIVEPRIGVSYSNLKMKGHEDGSIKIAKINQQQLDLNAGLVLTSFYDTNAFTLMPEISADYSHTIWSKGNKVKISNRLDQNILSQKVSKNKGAVKLGAGLNVLADIVEFGGGYENIIQDKSRAHIGYVKLRINF
jgi:hypothetical protein